MENEMNDYKIGTKCVQAGYTPENGQPRQIPIIQSTTFKYSTSEDMGKLFDLEASGYFYTRLQNPTNDAVAAKIVTGLKDICTDCDMVIEVCPENMAIKKQTFAELQQIVKKDCIFATNTSSLSITEMGNGLDRPLVGMHFFNPADRMKLVEVIAGVNTPAETVDTIKKISEEIGKTPVQVNEAAGFVVNRILIPMINEAAFIKMEGVSDIAGIDAAMKLGANHPMGPLELGDFVGLDICLAIMDVLYNETGDSKYRACPLIRKMVRGGNLGVKTGKGFYVYNADRTKTPVDAQ